MKQAPFKDAATEKGPAEDPEDPAASLAKARADIASLAAQIKRERAYREALASEAIGALLAKYRCRLQVANADIQIIAE